MSTTDFTNDERYSDFKSFLEKLRDVPLATVDDLCTAVQEAFGLHANLTNGSIFPDLFSRRCNKMAIEMVDNKPHCVVQVCWRYPTAQSAPVYIHGVSGLFDDIKVERIFSHKSHTTHLETNITIDLTRWQHVARNTLHACVILDGSSSKHQPAMMALLNYFYPDVDVAALRLSVELGLIDNDVQRFSAALDNMRRVSGTHVLTTPTDLAT